MKKLPILMLIFTMLVNIPGVIYGAEENKKIYLNEGFENTPTNDTPLKASIKGEGNIIRVVNNGRNKAILVRNKAISTVTFSSSTTNKYVFIETRVVIKDNNSDKAVIQIKTGDKTVDLITFKAGGKITDNIGNQIGSFITGEWYDVAVKFNTQTRIYDAYIDNNTILRRTSDATVKGNINSVGFTSYLSKNNETVFMVDYMRVYSSENRLKDSDFPKIKFNQTEKPITADTVLDAVERPEIYFSENFDGITSVPSSITTKGSPITIEKDGDNSYLYMLKSGETNMYSEVNLSKTMDKLVIEADVKSIEKEKDTTLFLIRDTKAVFANFIRLTAKGEIALYNGKLISSKNIIGQWANIAVVMNFGSKTFDVYIDRELVAKNIAFSNTGISEDIMLVRIDMSAGQEVDDLCIDNLRIYTGSKLLDDEIFAASDDTDKSTATKPNSHSAGKGIMEDAPNLTPDMKSLMLVEETPSENPSNYFTDYSLAKTIFKDSLCFVLDNNRAWVKDGRYYIDKAPMLYKGSTIVPAKTIGQTFGLSVEWDDKTSTVTLGGKITAKDGESNLRVGGKEVETAVPVQVIDGTIYIPLKEFASDVMGKYYFQSFKGTDIVSDNNMSLSDDKTITEIKDMLNYIVFDRPNSEYIISIFEEKNPNNVRPRVVGRKADFERIKSYIDTDQNVKAWSDKVLEAAAKKIIEPLPKWGYDSGNLRMQGFTSTADIMTLYWAFYLTGDIAYAKKAEERGLQMASFPEWNAKQHFLETANAAAANGLIIDLFYDQLSQESRDTIANAIIQFALIPALEHYNGKGASNWPIRENNWNIVCNGNLVQGAMALMGEYETELCAEVIEKAMKSSEYMMHTYAPEGAWMEGPSYWQYTVSTNVMMAFTLENVFGKDFGLMSTPGVMSTGYFPIYVSGNTGAFAYHDAPITYNVNSSELFWFAGKNKDPGLMKLRLDSIKKYSFSGSIKDILWYNPDMTAQNVDLALDKYYSYTEVATMRSDWGSSASFAAIHAGGNNVPHGQIDMGNFEYEVFGSRFATDTGSDDYNLPGYFGGQRYEYYVNRAEGHNIYVINPDSSGGQERNANSVIETVVTKPRGVIYKIDLTSAYKNQLKKAERGFMMMQNRKVFVVQDEISPNGGDNYNWFWHTYADAQVNDDGKSVTLTRNGKTVRLYFESNVDFTLEVGSAVPLESSPNDTKQKQLNMNKITAKFTSGNDDIIFRAAAVPEGVKYTAAPLDPMSKWTIPDGEMAQFTGYADNIYLDGVPIEGFDKLKLEYDVELDSAAAPFPTITSSGAENIKIIQPERENPTGTIEVQSSKDPESITYYTLNFKANTKIGIPSSPAISPIEITVSAEPQPENIAKNANDNNASTRWSAENTAWIQYDLGGIKTINAVALMIYQGAARKQYFDIQVSDDGENFTDVLVGGSTLGTNADLEFMNIFPTKARYLRLNCYGTSAGTWNSIVELSVHGE